MKRSRHATDMVSVADSVNDSSHSLCLEQQPSPSLSQQSSQSLHSANLSAASVNDPEDVLNADLVRKKKRGKIDTSELSEKQKQRVLKNRASAKASQMKKEVALQQAKADNDQLRSENELLQSRVQVLEQQNIDLMSKMEQLQSQFELMSNMISTNIGSDSNTGSGENNLDSHGLNDDLSPDANAYLLPPSPIQSISTHQYQQLQLQEQAESPQSAVLKTVHSDDINTKYPTVNIRQRFPLTPLESSSTTMVVEFQAQPQTVVSRSSCQQNNSCKLVQKRVISAIYSTKHSLNCNRSLMKLMISFLSIIIIMIVNSTYLNSKSKNVLHSKIRVLQQNKSRFRFSNSTNNINHNSNYSKQTQAYEAIITYGRERMVVRALCALAIVNHLGHYYYRYYRNQIKRKYELNLQQSF
ncbi:hypothetical protein MIR68_006617 [Amoeboaphelidium protococcarum]|nr:hypothetical protein MIR68_006617 [Amoeboaphelidium protococcarum]